jgi:hypothetical protein
MAAGYAKRMLLVSPRFPPNLMLNREGEGAASDGPLISSPDISSLRKYEGRTLLTGKEKSGPG